MIYFRLKDLFTLSHMGDWIEVFFTLGICHLRVFALVVSWAIYKIEFRNLFALFNFFILSPAPNPYIVGSAMH